jgi:sulfide:quinone oxidoreductase
MTGTTSDHRVLILGGGSAGISVAARLRRAGVADVAVVEPAQTHYYQPLWTLVGGGCAPASESARPEASVMPKGVSWIRDRAEEIDPQAQTVRTAHGVRLGYDHLVVCPGIALDWGKVSGMADAV